MGNIFNLTNKVALVTGGGSGIGLGIARQFIHSGAKVVITGRNPEKLQEARNELGENCFVIQNDVTDKSSHPALIRQIENEIGPIDVLVNNAGMHSKVSSLEMEDDAFQKIIDINLNSVFALSREVLKMMVPRGRGSVINISSMSALYGLPQIAAYSSSKTALLGLTRALASEFSYSGVRINAIAPGFIAAGMTDNLPQENKDAILARIPLGHFGTADDVAELVAFLASERASYITAQVISIDGGVV